MHTKNMGCNKCFRALLVIAFVFAAVVGCRKDPFERPLGLQSRRVVLSPETGVTPVIVYSNTSWTVSFSSEVSWAGLDKLSGQGSGGVYFSYAANYGPERQVTLVFEAGGVRDTCVMVQQARP